MANIDNKIEAKDKSIGQVLQRQQFVIDEYQRSYSWKRKQIETLLDDLYYNFTNNLSESNKDNDVRLFDVYFMGPIVVSLTKTSKSIVDGQQRLTTFTLLLIFLHHLCNELKISCDINLMSYVCYKRGENLSFVLNIPQRKEIMDVLVDGRFEEMLEISKSLDKENDDSVNNIINAYQQISDDFPPDLRNKETLPMFIEWLLDKVIVVEISAFTNEKAYTIFETMNDRGLSLTPTEILKAHIISQIEDEDKKSEVNKLWLKKINNIIQNAGENSDADFFKAWFRAKYADTIRSSSTNKKKEDFESIGANYHTWFKNNKKFNLHSSLDYYFFLKGDFDFFSDVYIRIKQHQWHEHQDMLRELYITSCYPMADSLYLPLLMSPLSKQDSEDDIAKKLLLVNDYVDDFNNIKTLSNQSISQTAVRNSINNLILNIRNSSVESLQERLIKEKEILLSNGLFSLKDFVPGLYYTHYFLARMISARNKEVAFCSLMRSKRQSSLIAMPIATYDEVSQLNIDNGMSYHHDVLINYCLIRRNEQTEYSQLPFSERLAWLRNKGYLTEMEGEPIDEMNIISFFESRKEKFTQFINKTWIPNVKNE